MTVTFSGASGAAGGVQQDYALVHAALLEGQLSDIRDNTIGTYVNETNAVLAFGNVVVFNSAGTVANSAKTIASASDDTVQGVNVLTYVDEKAVDALTVVLVLKTSKCSTSPVEGAVAVFVHGSVTPATAVRVIHTVSGVQYAGQFRAAALSWQNCSSGECSLPHFCYRLRLGSC
jgi:hypothetical protein